MDNQFTMKLQEWINTPSEKRDYEQGALFLLQLTNNKILYRNIARNTKRHAEFISYKIKRYLQFRLQNLTHDEVQIMQRKVDNINAEHGLDRIPASTEKKDALSETEQFRAGKRADHDTLPDEIQALFIENADIMRKMRELHLQLRNLSAQSSTCPDSDRYPFLKELIELDKRYHKNWQLYDNFSMESKGVQKGGKATAQPSTKAQVVLDEEARQQQKNVLRQINLAKGRYKKKPSEKAKESIAALYGQLTAPSDILTEELKEMGIIA